MNPTTLRDKAGKIIAVRLRFSREGSTHLGFNVNQTTRKAFMRFLFETARNTTFKSDGWLWEEGIAQPHSPDYKGLTFFENPEDVFVPSDTYNALDIFGRGRLGFTNLQHIRLETIGDSLLEGVMKCILLSPSEFPSLKTVVIEPPNWGFGAYSYDFEIAQALAPKLSRLSIINFAIAVHKMLGANTENQIPTPSVTLPIISTKPIKDLSLRALKKEQYKLRARIRIHGRLLIWKSRAKKDWEFLKYIL